MIKKILIFNFLLISGFVSLSGCSNDAPEKITDETVTYVQISQDEAKRLMDSEKDYIILDVRTQEEYDGGHIENAILIPDYEIEEKAENVIPDKDKLILVYCRSGRRSKIASEKLAEMGYKNVKEFGGINTWEYGTVR